MRKTRFEEELDELERNIKKLSRGKVLVTED